MDNKEFIELRENYTGNDNNTEIEETQKFLIFTVEDKYYCFPSEEVKEIVISQDLYYIPFCPPYIRGLVNRHGEPFTVFDIQVLIKNKKQENSKFLIMNLKEDKVAFMIEDILEIIEVPVSGLINLPIPESENEFFYSYIQYQKNHILVLSLQKILQRLENDIK